MSILLAVPYCHAELRAEKPQSEHYPREIKTLCDPIRTRRLDLKLLQKQVAEQIRVNSATITNWERNASTPVVRYMPAVLRPLSYDPLPPAESLSARLRSARRRLGLTQRKMADQLGVDACTMRDWEKGRHQPTQTSLDLIARVLEKLQSD